MGYRLNRRSFLGGLAATGIAHPAFAQLASNPDVVVVGAGAAGIAAARTLIAAGRSVVVVEADARAGGRAYTDTSIFGVPFDIGCAWIHAADRNPLYPLAQAAGYRLQFHDLALETLYYGRRKASAKDVAAEIAAEEEMIEAISAMAEARDGPSSLAVADWTPSRRAAATYLGPMDMGVDLDELSSADYANSADLDPNYFTYEGFGSLVALQAQGLPIRLSTPATKIRYGARRGVSVETPAGTIAAKAVLVTVSTGVLAHGGIAFDPPLPDWKQQAIADVPMGMLAKIPLLIKGDRFGAKPFDDILVERAGKADIYFLAFPFDTDLLVGFVGGDFGWELSAAGEAAAADFAKQCLADAFGSKAPAKVEKSYFTKWASNPFTRGAYAAASPGAYAARADLARTLNERVFFAGEALAGEFIQTCGGAYASGEEAASAILTAIV